MSKSKPYPVFISGELCDLCVPNEQAIVDGWADWFNDPKITAWLDHGVFPNHLEDQQEFLDGIRKRNRFAVLICGKGGWPLLGVVSISSIRWISRSGQIALVCVQQGLKSKLIPLEALALVTEHGFEKMGLERIWAGLAYDGRERLTAWMELIGYRTDGIHRAGFTKGRTKSDAIAISCLYDGYSSLVRRRGRLWPGNSQMRRLIARRPKESMAALVRQTLNEIAVVHFAKLDAIELDDVTNVPHSGLLD